MPRNASTRRYARAGLVSCLACAVLACQGASVIAYDFEGGEIRADDTHLFWTDYEGVFRLPRDGGDRQRVYQRGSSLVAMTASRLVLTERVVELAAFGVPPAEGWKYLSIAKGGGDARPLPGVSPSIPFQGELFQGSLVAAGEDALYWVGLGPQGNSALHATRLDDGVTVELHRGVGFGNAAVPGTPAVLGTAAGFVIWTHDGTTLLATPIAEPAHTRTLATDVTASTLAYAVTDATGVYFGRCTARDWLQAEVGPGLTRIALEGSRTELAIPTDSSHSRCGSLAIVQGRARWIEGGNVYEVPIEGGTPTVIGVLGEWALPALIDTRVYWRSTSSLFVRHPRLMMLDL